MACVPEPLRSIGWVYHKDAAFLWQPQKATVTWFWRWKQWSREGVGGSQENSLSDLAPLAELPTPLGKYLENVISCFPLLLCLFLNSQSKDPILPLSASLSWISNHRGSQPYGTTGLEAVIDRRCFSVDCLESLWHSQTSLIFLFPSSGGRKYYEAIPSYLMRPYFRLCHDV